VAFTFDFEQKKKDLKNICPEWEEKNIEKIDRGTLFVFYICGIFTPLTF
jgi:hypothetical protein